MDLAQVLAALETATGYELYQLQAAIAALLEDPRWVPAVRRRLRPGQSLRYFDARAHRIREGRLLRLRDTDLLVQAAGATARPVPYAAVLLEAVAPAVPPEAGRLSRHHLATGEQVCFADPDGVERSGQVVRLNERTATVACAGGSWRVSYAALRRPEGAGEGAGEAGIPALLPEP